MTITVTDPHIPAQREPGHDQTVTPESQRLAELRQQLAEYANDPAVGGWADAIRDEIRQLTATSVLGA